MNPKWNLSNAFDAAEIAHAWKYFQADESWAKRYWHKGEKFDR